MVLWLIFRVYGRETGSRNRHVERDLLSLDWFLIKTGEQYRKEYRAQMVQDIETSSDFKLQRSWDLPDGSLLKLYHRTIAPIQVKPITGGQTKISLDRVTVPQQGRAGQPSTSYL